MFVCVVCIQNNWTNNIIKCRNNIWSNGLQKKYKIHKHSLKQEFNEYILCICEIRFIFVNIRCDSILTLTHIHTIRRINQSKLRIVDYNLKNILLSSSSKNNKNIQTHPMSQAWKKRWIFFYFIIITHKSMKKKYYKKGKDMMKRERKQR